LFASILPAGAQEAHAETPDPAIFDARYEEAFAAAVAMPDDTEPTDVLQAWGVAMMSAVMVDRARAIAELGENAPPPDGEAVNEQVLARWQQMRPESGGPDLFRALSIRDPATKRAVIIGLLDRYPDNVLVVSQALQQWLHAGEAARAVDVAETFLARNPDHPLAYGLLLQAMDSNETLLIDALRRWAQVAPGEPRLLVTFGWHLFGRQRRHPFGGPAACRLALARLLMQATLRPNKRRLSGFHAMKARGISSLRSGLVTSQ
jgi:hypothetical protein